MFNEIAPLHRGARPPSAGCALRARRDVCARLPPLADETLSMSGPDAAESKARICAESDFVVCSLPGTADTKHFCDAGLFASMKQSGVFISLGRGVAVDEAALCEALRAGTIAGAACDVFEVEPLPEASPLWDAPNVTLLCFEPAPRVASCRPMRGCQPRPGPWALALPLATWQARAAL